MNDEKILEHLIRIESALTKNQSDIDHYFQRIRKLEEDMIKVQKVVGFSEISFKLVTMLAAIGTVYKVFSVFH